jgi:hypothetical protein
MRRIVILGLSSASLAMLPPGGAGAAAPVTTFAAAGRQALATLLHTWYGGNGSWRECDQAGCPEGTGDWGVDSLTYALYLRWATSADASIPPVMSALTAAGPAYPEPCVVPACSGWSDVPQWDTIAAVREYQVTRDPLALAHAEAAFAYAESSNAYALGACPAIRYQQPSGGINHLKTLETDANAIKAAILLYQVTGQASYLRSATTRYDAVRSYFLARSAPLYTVYVFDDGTACRQAPARFFASVNGDMIWSGAELARATNRRGYLREAVATAQAVATRLADPAGVFADLQAENDIVEPLVEGMYALATEAGQTFARSWILTNATAALSARTADGSFGRFFDGPAPRTTVTAWQTNGGLALEIAAAALAPGQSVPLSSRWAGARRIAESVGPTGTIHFTGSAIALLGTLGEVCCESGHARVLVDGKETYDQTGIWQNKSSLGRKIAGEILFAWRWPTRGEHRISFEPGVPNGKEGTSFLHIRGYLVLP